MKAFWKKITQGSPGTAGTIALTALVTCVVTLAAALIAFNIKYGRILSTVEKYNPVYEAISLVEQQFVGDVDSEAVSEGAVDGIVNSLGDRWSYYIYTDGVDNYSESINNSYVGVGLYVTKAEGENIYVQSVNPQGGAFKAGIESGDYIAEVDGQSVSELTLNESRALIVGPEDSSVNLTVYKSDGSVRELSVTRQAISTVGVEGELLDGNIGYVTIANFNNGVSDAFKETMDDLLARGAEAFIFDVRFNNGGKLSELLDMLDYLLPEVKLFSSVSSAGDEKVYNSDADCVELPMAVLINDSSYSAAEFFAAALQEYDWATIVGQSTGGKGWSQTTHYLSDGSAVVLSTGSYYTPQGRSLIGVGVTPDISALLTSEDYYNLYLGKLDRSADVQFQAAKDTIKHAIGG